MINRESVAAASAAGASVGRSAGAIEGAEATGAYVIQCFDAAGRLKWSEHIENVVTTVGKNDALDKYLSGSSYTAAWYVGLISSDGYSSLPVAADTASAHPSWQEDTRYTQSNRPTASFAVASGGQKSMSSSAVFSINATTAIKGMFLISNSTKGGSSGILYSAGLFSGGDKALASGDVLNVGYTAAL